MPEKCHLYIAVKLLIMPTKLGFPFGALLINIRTQISKIRIYLKAHLFTGDGMLKYQ